MTAEASFYMRTEQLLYAGMSGGWMCVEVGEMVAVFKF
jgi:hypothetical protein